MCGFAGIVGEGASRAPIEAAIHTIAHRGPDGEGIFHDDNCALAHRRLAIIDLSAAAAQPMTDPVTGVTIAYNGEIYNYREVRDILRGPFFSQSDTEVILRAYIERGIESVSLLSGMFAFAIWDPRDKSLHLVRDRFGIKPLFFNLREDGALLFGSEIKALLALGVPSKPALDSIYTYLTTGTFAHNQRTFFADINCVLPGNILTWRGGRVEHRQYWSPDSLEASSERECDFVEMAWDVLGGSIRRHLVSDVPVGLSLSSGLDSQLMLHVLAKIAPRDYHSYTFGFDEAAYDEIRRNETTNFAVPLHRHSLRTRPSDLLDDIEPAIRIFECPLGGLGTLAAYRLMRLPPKDGVLVLLSGEGSDEAFGGYRYFYDWYLRELYEEGDMVLLKREIAAYNKIYNERLDPASEEFKTRILRASLSQLAPDGSALGGNRFVSRSLIEAASNCAEEWHLQIRQNKSSLRARMLVDLTSLKIPKLLWFQDRSSMAWGVEVRVPFLDPEVISFAFRLPSQWIIRDGIQKYLPKLMLSRFCGVNYDGSQKLFVSTPQREWLKGSLLAQILSYLDQGPLACSGYIDYDAFRKAARDYAAHADLGNSFFIWQIWNLDVLMRIYFPRAQFA